MEPKSVEQYKRELMEMFRIAVIKNPDYAMLCRRPVAVQEQIQIEPETEEIITDFVQEQIPEIDFTQIAVPVNMAIPVPEVRMPIAAQGNENPQSLVNENMQRRANQNPQSLVSENLQRRANENPQNQAADTALEAGDTMMPSTQVQTPPQMPLQTQETQEEIRLPRDMTQAEMQTDNRDGTRLPGNVTTTMPSSAETFSGEEPEDVGSMPARVEREPEVRTTPEIMPQAQANENYTGSGLLIVNVTTGRGAMPVANAKVTVVTPTESGNIIMAQTTTDNSGRTEPITLPAPVREFPRYPETFSNEGMSAIYTVVVDAPGYITAINKEVAVFDGVTSVQRIDLMVQTGSEDESQPRVVTEVNRNAF